MTSPPIMAVRVKKSSGHKNPPKLAITRMLNDVYIEDMALP
jgi:hypothetical protein